MLMSVALCIPDNALVGMVYLFHMALSTETNTPDIGTPSAFDSPMHHARKPVNACSGCFQFHSSLLQQEK